MTDNRVMRNLPPLYHDIKEFEELMETEAIELDELDTARKRVEDEQFIMSSSEKGIKRRENGLKIRADPTTETLDFRRRRLINRNTTKLPLSERKIIEILSDLVGGTNFEVDLDVEACTSDFLFDASEETINKEFDETLERVIPLNILYRVVRRVKTELFFPCTAFGGEETTIYPWREAVLNLNATMNLGTASRSFETMTVYPK